VGKIIDAGNIQGDKLGRRSMLCLRELGILENLSTQHPGIVRLVGHQMATTESLMLIVTEYLKEGDLNKFMMKRNRPSLCGLEAAHVVRQLLDALGFLHERNVIHRDVKPGNVLVANWTDTESGILQITVKLADFGLSKLRIEAFDSGDSINGFVGTRTWAAPEMFKCQDWMTHHHETRRAWYNSTALDVWSVGILLYQLLTSKLPGDIQKSPSGQDNPCPGLSCQTRINEDVRKNVAPETDPPLLQSLILRQLEKDPNSRMSIENSVKMLNGQLPEDRSSGTGSDSFSRSDGSEGTSHSAFFVDLSSGDAPSVYTVGNSSESCRRRSSSEPSGAPREVRRRVLSPVEQEAWDLELAHAMQEDERLRAEQISCDMAHAQQVQDHMVSQHDRRHPPLAEELKTWMPWFSRLIQ
jgi:serine/threonine protein kinase